jgi:predicted TIM-barrel fold metal-dependent hydrolase
LSKACRRAFPSSAPPSSKLARHGCRITWIASTSIGRNALKSRCRCSKKNPATLVRKSDVYFSIEPGESRLAHTIDYVGSDHFLFASDIPHWDCEFPGNLQHIRNDAALSKEVKEKILYKNAKRLFNL